MPKLPVRLSPTVRQLTAAAAMLVLLTAAGIVGFRVTESSSWLDSAWLAVVTLTTLGADSPSTAAGKLFAMGYLLCGLGVASYSLFALGQMVVSTEFRRMWEQRKMDEAISGLSGHNVICGLGRIGQGVCGYLSDRQRPFVVIDQDRELLERVCDGRGWLYVVGDAADDAVLKKAGVDRAASLNTALPTDAENIYVVLSARGLSDRLQIVARATEERAIGKLERAGADRVVSPLASGAVKMARVMLNPHVEDFLAIADGRESDLELADVQIAEGSALCGKTLKDSGLSGKGLMIVGIRRGDGKRIMPPAPDAVIQAGDCLFTFGKRETIAALTHEDGVRDASHPDAVVHALRGKEGTRGHDSTSPGSRASG
ncbi:potassium channel family protein [Alienimonas californiensis]|uniref:Voltage-gated potassium channel Kch n=1 Tax=Alienimonas californiensis TaxID=2527989 RepID=A0A517PA85_9PLAN|nr:potassium channel protein [Alienimonas californiensis]QDT16272.1 Voltage-gated potassium channel Kch [Alienimonas californiensis]